MKRITALMGTAVMVTVLLATSCTKKRLCVCTIDNERYEYDLSGQNGVNAKASCDAMKLTMNLSGTGKCKLE